MVSAVGNSWGNLAVPPPSKDAESPSNMGTKMPYPFIDKYSKFWYSYTSTEAQNGSVNHHHHYHASPPTDPLPFFANMYVFMHGNIEAHCSNSLNPYRTALS